MESSTAIGRRWRLLPAISNCWQLGMLDARVSVLSMHRSAGAEAQMLYVNDLFAAKRCVADRALARQDSLRSKVWVSRAAVSMNAGSCMDDHKANSKQGLVRFCSLQAFKDASPTGTRCLCTARRPKLSAVIGQQGVCRACKAAVAHQRQSQQTKIAYTHRGGFDSTVLWYLRSLRASWVNPAALQCPFQPAT